MIEYSPDTVVSVVGFCILLAVYPVWLRMMPAVAAFIVPLYPEQAAFTAYVVVLLMGTAWELVKVGLSFAGQDLE